MADFYTEQVFAAPLTTVAERLLVKKLDFCARGYSARWREGLVDRERQRMVCRFEADDLRAARAAALCSGLDPDATWLSPVHRAAATASGNSEAAVGLVDVIAECRQDVPVDAASLMAEQHACVWCLETFRVHPGPLVMSADGRRVLALFRAPDAEAVRMAYRHASLAFDRVVALRRIEHPAPGSGGP
ncbi:MAG TPA: hypothetical protein VJK00_11885 [Steroidobacteraceae bacterium]|nr:hypothetical protein [Steroidobacteraceae bacterium]HTG77455.1 hypothetical protein [Steroidobacteraceae bacterium]